MNREDWLRRADGVTRKKQRQRRRCKKGPVRGPLGGRDGVRRGHDSTCGSPPPPPPRRLDHFSLNLHVVRHFPFPLRAAPPCFLFSFFSPSIGSNAPSMPHASSSRSSRRHNHAKHATQGMAAMALADPPRLRHAAPSYNCATGTPLPGVGCSSDHPRSPRPR